MREQAELFAEQRRHPSSWTSSVKVAAAKRLQKRRSRRSGGWKPSPPRPTGSAAAESGVFRAPPVEWIKEQLSNLQVIIEHRTARSAQVLRNILGPIRMGLVTPDIGRPFYRAVTAMDALA